MNYRARLPLAAAAALVVATGLAGCTTSPGAAAVVGGDRISAETLQAAVNRALADPAAQRQLGQDRAGFVRNELSRLITNVIVGRAAAAQHVTVTNSDIDHELDSLAQQAGGQQQLVQAASASGVPRPDLRTFVRYFVMQQKLGDVLAADVNVSDAELQAEYQKNIDKYDVVDSAHILLKTKAEADQVLAQVRENPSSFIEVHSQFGWHVVHVIAHKTTPLAEVAPQLKATILGPKRQALVQQELSGIAKRVGVHVNPRYGRWDARADKVVAPRDKDALSSPAPSSS